jgi:phage FluMu protein Com
MADNRMPKLRCKICGKELEEVIQTYEVLMKFDVKEDAYINEGGTGTLTTRCPDCKETLEEY